MPEKGHRTSLRIEASFPIMVTVGLIRRRIKLSPNDLIPTFKCAITGEIIGDSCVFANILNFQRSENLFENFFKNLS